MTSAATLGATKEGVGPRPQAANATSSTHRRVTRPILVTISSVTRGTTRFLWLSRSLRGQRKGHADTRHARLRNHARPLQWMRRSGSTFLPHVRANISRSGDAGGKARGSGHTCAEKSPAVTVGRASCRPSLATVTGSAKCGNALGGRPGSPARRGSVWEERSPPSSVLCPRAPPPLCGAPRAVLAPGGPGYSWTGRECPPLTGWRPRLLLESCPVSGLDATMGEGP